MTFDTLDTKAFQISELNVNDKLKSFNSMFTNTFKPEYETFLNVRPEVESNLVTWLGIEDIGVGKEDFFTEHTEFILRNMYYDDAAVLYDGSRALTLSELSTWQLDPASPYYDINLKQQAGFAAEILSTAKDNIIAEALGKDVTTYTPSEKPGYFSNNDPYVDKFRVDNKTGEVVERVQVKFVGNDADGCLKKLVSKKYDKYLNDGKVDKIEVPKDYYDDIKKMIPDKVSELEKQLERVKADGKTEVADKIEKRIAKYKKVDEMLEKSNTTRQEAIDARLNPDKYMKKIFANKTLVESNKAGLESGAFAAGLTAAVSTYDNVQKYMDGKITAQEAALDIVKDTGTAGALGYGTAFVSTAVTSVMSESSHELIKKVAGSGAPGIVISFGIDTYDSVIDYAQGKIDASQLAYDLGEGAVHIAGSVAGAAASAAVSAEVASNVGAVVGGAVGSVVPGAGTAAGMVAGKVTGYGVGMVAGMVGCAIASEAYATAVEFGAENAGVLAEKAKVAAQGTIELAKLHAPEKVADIRNAVNDYASKFNLPFSV